MLLSRGRRLAASLLLPALAACDGGGGAGSEPLPVFHPDPAAITVTGPDVPGAERFDEAVKELMVRWNVPGATVAVARDGKLVLARGYGFADFELGLAVTPDSRFRIASISKVLTAMAALRLADEGHVDLDVPFLDLLPGARAEGDARLADVTVRDLLRHSGGWDRTRSPDYTQWQERIAAERGVASPASAAAVADYVLGRRLDFDPGSRYAYSNVGYLLLGRVLEAVSGEPYERHVRDHVLAELGVHAMAIGDGQLAGLAEDEVRYYSTLRLESAFPGEGSMPAPYVWSLDAMDAMGGWIATAVDLTRVLTALDGSRTAPFLSAAGRDAMLVDPHLLNSGGRRTFGLAGLPGAWFYGLGLFVSADDPGAWWHGGSLPGSQTCLGRTADGEVYALMVNTREERTASIDAFSADVWRLVPEVIAQGEFGSAEDLYPLFPSPERPAHQP